MKKITTLVIVHTDHQVLLGLKKRGFGEGLWNGFGGKVEESEAIEDAALRELHEEVGLIADHMTSIGVIDFTFRDSPLIIQMNLFRVTKFTGEPVETEEMKPQWYSHNEVPYEAMWSDDMHWLPHVLAGKKVTARFHFDDPDTQTILDKEIIINA